LKDLNLEAPSDYGTAFHSLSVSRLRRRSQPVHGPHMVPKNVRRAFTRPISSRTSCTFVSRLIFDFSVDVLKVKRISVSWRKA
jgi:hypothetical protein